MTSPDGDTRATSRVASEPFAWHETRAVVDALSREHDLVADARGRAFATADGALRIVVPPLLPEACDPVTDWLDALPDALGTQLVVLLQAGAAALGFWQDGELIRHKVFTRYVVRGTGRAQPTHLRVKGKSRYGSRLRLQNAQRLLAEVNERQAEWVGEVGVPDRAFLAAVVRLRADLFAAEPAPPLPAADYRKVPLTVRRPGFDELLRVYRALGRGAVERRATAAGS